MTAKTTEALARKRDKDRERERKRKAQILEQAKAMPPVECECGCGTLIPALKTDGKPRRFADRHGSRAPKFRIETNPIWVGGDLPRFNDEPACAEEDPELFFNSESFPVAKTICGRCPVRAQCAAWAIERREPLGVWGGLAPLERLRQPARGRSTAELARSAVDEAPARGLTYAEKQAAVAWLTARGDTAEQIADRLGLSSRTVVRWRTRLKEAKAA